MLSFQIPIVIGGVVIAYVIYRRLAGARLMDPRLEIRHELESLRRVAESLLPQINLAKRSRLAIAEAKGLSGSEATRLWLCELQSDLAEAELLASRVPSTDMPADDRLAMGLEIRLAEILDLSIRANTLAEKYRLSLCADAADSARLSPQAASPPEAAPALQPGMSLIASS
jgi:hypothetical protein